jgi:hypothetical protein
MCECHYVSLVGVAGAWKSGAGEQRWVDKALYIGNYNTERKTKQIPQKQVRQHKYKTKYKVPAATKA